MGEQKEEGGEKGREGRGWEGGGEQKRANTYCSQAKLVEEWQATLLP